MVQRPIRRLDVIRHKNLEKFNQKEVRLVPKTLSNILPTPKGTRIMRPDIV